jgi:hypothetical protein
MIVVVCLVAATATGPWWYTWRAWGLACLSVATGAAAAWAARRPVVVRGGPVVVRGEGAGSGDAGVHQPPLEVRPLVEALVDLLDQNPLPAQRYRMERALSAAGLTPFRADGEVFDPARHMAVAVEPTDDPSRVHRVAQTLRPGYSQGGLIVQVAQVLVYRGASTGTSREGSTVR